MSYPPDFKVANCRAVFHQEVSDMIHILATKKDPDYQDYIIGSLLQYLETNEKWVERFSNENLEAVILALRMLDLDYQYLEKYKKIFGVPYTPLTLESTASAVKLKFYDSADYESDKEAGSEDDSKGSPNKASTSDSSDESPDESESD